MKETNFKMTELGSIPNEWLFGCFEDFLTTFSSGATPYRAIQRYYSGSINWISSGELDYNLIHDTKEHITPEAVRNTNLTIHKLGTFLMAITGLEAAGTRGRCAMVGTPSTTNQSCLAINSTKRMTTDYLFWFYQFWSEVLAFKYSQGSKQQSFTSAIVKKLPIYAPKELSEQSRIASALSEVDSLLSSLDKLIAKKQAIKEGTMQQLLTGKTRLKGFEGEWRESTVGELVTRQKGSVLPCIRPQEYFIEYSMPAFDEGKVPSVCKGAAMLSCRIPIHGKVLLVNKLNVRQKRIWLVEALKENSVCSGEFIPFEASDICLDYLKYLFLTKTVVQDWIDNSTGTSNSQRRISPSYILEYKVRIPLDKKEQAAIASILTSIDSELFALQAKRKKYEAMKQGMMQQLLTGKIRLV